MKSNIQDPISVARCLGFGQLKGILERVRQIQTWNQRLYKALSQEMHAHYRVINCYDSILVITAINATWATRLRYQVPELLAQFAQYVDGQTIQSIICRVQLDS